MQWLIMQGSFFVTSVFLQTVRHYNAIETGLILTPATIGILLTSALAGRMAQRRLQKRLISGGFALAIIGIVLLLLLSDATSNILTFIPGLFLFGVGVGVMLTASVNVVQSSFPDKDQGEISGLSRSVSNLGSSLGTAFVGSVLVSEVVPGNGIYGAALIVMGAFALIGFIAGALLPRHIAGAPQAVNAAA
jgi:MFS family permease